MTIAISFWPTFHYTTFHPPVNLVWRKSQQTKKDSAAAKKKEKVGAEDVWKGGINSDSSFQIFKSNIQFKYTHGYSQIGHKKIKQKVSAKDGEKDAEKEGEKKDANTSKVGCNKQAQQMCTIFLESLAWCMELH